MRKKIFSFMFIFMFVLLGLSFNQTEVFAKTKNYSSKQRVGNTTVGFIDFPNGWTNFYDPNAGTTAVQISKGPINIVTLDTVPNDGNLVATQGIINLQNHFLQMGLKKENTKLAKATINGNKAEELNISVPDGRKLIIYLIDKDKKIYYISLEGLPEEIPNLFNVIDNSWDSKK